MSLFIIFLGAGLGPFFFFFFVPPTAPPWAHLLPTAAQFANQLFGGFSYVFGHYIPIGLRVGRAAISDIVQDLTTGTQRIGHHRLGPAPQACVYQADETAEKFADPLSSPNVKRGGDGGTDPRSS